MIDLDNCDLRKTQLQRDGIHQLSSCIHIIMVFESGSPKPYPLTCLFVLPIGCWPKEKIYHPPIPIPTPLVGSGRQREVSSALSPPSLWLLRLSCWANCLSLPRSWRLGPEEMVVIGLGTTSLHEECRLSSLPCEKDSQLLFRSVLMRQACQHQVLSGKASPFNRPAATQLLFTEGC